MLTATYESMRATILNGFLTSPDNYNQAYVFAWYHRMFPMLLVDAGELVFEPATTIRIFEVGLVYAKLTEYKKQRKVDELNLETFHTLFPGIGEEKVKIILSYLNIAGWLSHEANRALQSHILTDELPTSFEPGEIRFPFRPVWPT